ncbi:MAG TPA: hypothetical protein VEK57_25010 [Thermoanaerobaculia bacterium]|nr:hypothetical protein [Thermoanaerobaculia bacterium]
MVARRPMGRQKKLRALRRALVLPFLVAALLVLPLALRKRWDSRIVADVEVSELSFDLRDTGTFLDPRPYERVHVSRSAAGELRAESGMTRLAIAPEGSLTVEHPRLDALQIEPKARVTLARPDPATLGVAIDGARAVTSWSLSDGASLECEWCDVDGTRHRHYQTKLTGDAVLTLESPNLRIVLVTANSAVIADNVSIARPTFVSGTAERPSSSVNKGMVTLRDLREITIEVPKGEHLAFGDPHDFRLNTVESGKSGGLHVIPSRLAAKSADLATHLATREGAASARAVRAWNIAAGRGTVAQPGRGGGGGSSEVR